MALAGGGPLGAIYEIGALCALQESLKGIHFNRLQHYVGVSAGGFIAAGLANGITPMQLFNLFIEDRKHQTEAFDPAWLLKPAFSEFFSRSLLLPELIDNLIDNALRYTGAGGSVTVSTGCLKDVPYLSVEDNGPGIPPSERSKVRERFYRIAGTPGEGSGLGLAIVQEVVDRHGGTLEITDRREQRGTCVRVLFPRNRNGEGNVL